MFSSRNLALEPAGRCAPIGRDPAYRGIPTLDLEHCGYAAAFDFNSLESFERRRPTRPRFFPDEGKAERPTGEEASRVGRESPSAWEPSLKARAQLMNIGRIAERSGGR